MPATVKAIEYDPNRTSGYRAAVLCRRREALHPRAEGARRSATRSCRARSVEPEVGNCMPLETRSRSVCQVHNVELQPGKGGQIARSAGNSAQLLARDGKYADAGAAVWRDCARCTMRCRATIGEIGNSDWQNVRWGKAGRKRHMGRRPHNRGTSMNPVAHPMGGGEGRTGGGRHPVSPQGKPAKGGKHASQGKARSNQVHSSSSFAGLASTSPWVVAAKAGVSAS